MACPAGELRHRQERSHFFGEDEVAQARGLANLLLAASPDNLEPSLSEGAARASTPRGSSDLRGAAGR